MGREKKKRTGSSKGAGRWSREKPTPKRASKPLGLRIIRGRYIIGLLLIGGIGRYAGVPLIESIRQHPVFDVRNVVVEGVDYLDPDAIIKTADVSEGDNIFDLDLASVSETLEHAYEAEDFVVFRRLPDTVAIRVRERKPVALLNASTIIGVDENGVPLPHVGAAFVETLPVISGVKSVEALSDSSVRERLKTGLKLLGYISDKAPSVYGRISEIDVSSVSDMGITLIDNGLEVIIGSDGWNKKIPKLDNVIARVSQQVGAVKAVDIRFGDKIFIRKK
ncbi:MAG: FtsQ-type POTRA domain-containing protein [Candidatus Latescibacteria bacterium]|nr:FtsQ-type POTRA domain-containing protein [Candidatus Latescibacterota bacterium]